MAGRWPSSLLHAAGLVRVTVEWELGSARLDFIPHELYPAPNHRAICYRWVMGTRALRRAGLVVAASACMLGAGWLTGALAAGSLPPLTGPPLSGPTHLHLIVGNTPPVVFDVDTGTTTTVPGVVPGPYTKTGQPLVTNIVPATGGAIVTVSNVRTYADYFISAAGTAQPVAPAANAIPARNSDAIWTLTSSHGSCTLQLVPGSRPAVRAPCGTLELDSPAGLVITTASYALVVDPSTGLVLRRIRATGQLERISASSGFLLQVSGQSSQFVHGKLVLINLATGTQRHLRWPSILPWVQRVAVEPHGPLVAVGFVSPAYPGPQQANDIWLLNPTTGVFTHLPGFPAQESVKFSDMAWTSDDRLVVVAESIASIAQNTTRAVLGVWQPGQTTLPLRSIPTLANSGGYSEFVPIVR